jgi:hypothetical protein
MRQAGWDTAYVKEANPGISDDGVLRWAVREDRILLTEDKDFGDIVFRMQREIPGVLLLRMPAGPWPSRWTRLRDVLDRHGNKLEGMFAVIRPGSMRFRAIA